MRRIVYLWNSIGVCTGVFATELVNSGLVRFCRELDQEISCIHLEHARNAAMESYISRVRA